MEEEEEDRYEAIELIIKSRDDGESWFDVIFNYITQDCQGTPYNDETDEEGEPCTCGMETMGGSGGTLDQCYAWSTSVGSKLQPIDLARAIVHLFEGNDFPLENLAQVVSWARSEIEFEEKWDNFVPEEEE